MILNRITTHTIRILRMNENCETSDTLHGYILKALRPSKYQLQLNGQKIVSIASRPA